MYDILGDLLAPAPFFAGLVFGAAFAMAKVWAPRVYDVASNLSRMYLKREKKTRYCVVLTRHYDQADNEYQIWYFTNKPEAVHRYRNLVEAYADKFDRTVSIWKKEAP